MAFLCSIVLTRANVEIASANMMVCSSLGLQPTKSTQLEQLMNTQWSTRYGCRMALAVSPLMYGNVTKMILDCLELWPICILMLHYSDPLVRSVMSPVLQMRWFSAIQRTTWTGYLRWGLLLMEWRLILVTLGTMITANLHNTSMAVELAQL